MLDSGHSNLHRRPLKLRKNHGGGEWRISYYEQHVGRGLQNPSANSMAWAFGSTEGRFTSASGLRAEGTRVATWTASERIVKWALKTSLVWMENYYKQSSISCPLATVLPLRQGPTLDRHAIATNPAAVVRSKLPLPEMTRLLRVRF